MQKHILLIVVVITSIIVSLFTMFNPKYYPHPDEHEIQDFKILKQPDSITCGPTSATMILNHLGVSTDIDDVKQKSKTEWFKFNEKPVGMTAPEDVTYALNQFEIKSICKQGSIDEIKHLVSNNKPVIVLLRSGKSLWHYVVVIGYNQNNIFIADPGQGKRRQMSEEVFLSSWEFQTDMIGNKSKTICKFCGGTGLWTSMTLGPFNRCILCDGHGEYDDIFLFLLKTMEAKPQTLIVPNVDNVYSFTGGISMFTIISLIFWIVFGFIVGYIAKLIHPGEDEVGFIHTICVGVAGSFIGGLIQWLIYGGHFAPAGLIFSILGGVIFCWVYRKYRLERFLKIQGRYPNKKCIVKKEDQK